MKRVLISGLLLLLGAAQASAEVLLVCQTPSFWCEYAWDSPIRESAPCACYSPRGPVPGRTLVPASLERGPFPPPPERPAGTRVEPQVPPSSHEQASSIACLNGLGDCPEGNSTN